MANQPPSAGAPSLYYDLVSTLHHPASRMESPLTEGHIFRMGGTVPIPINGSIARIWRGRA